VLCRTSSARRFVVIFVVFVLTHRGVAQAGLDFLDLSNPPASASLVAGTMTPCIVAYIFERLLGIFSTCWPSRTPFHP
jgi:hypothetical protein